jgi:hypothetical protein
LIDAGTSLASARLSEAIAALDFVRRSPAASGGRGAHKEWQHFAIMARDVTVLVNFSCCDAAGAAQVSGSELPRLVLMARTRDHGWDGDVETYRSDEVAIPGGRIEMVFPGSRLAFGAGVFEIDASLRARPIAVRLRLAPRTMPVFVPSVPMLDGPPLHWTVVPRLDVTGVLRVRGREYVLDGASAYHDHNWGHFLWGHDVAWEWGFVLPDEAREPWCLTFVRLTNRARTLALAHKLLLWRGEDLVAVFREGDVTSEANLSHLQLPRIFKVPRPMALVVPDLATDVPGTITTSAHGDDGWLECRCDTEDLAQVLIPSEDALGVTIFNEACARTTVRGRIAGETVDFVGRSILEFIRYA